MNIIYKKIALIAILAFILIGCASSQAPETPIGGNTVEIEDNHGLVEVPINPEKLVVLDSRIMETLQAWDIKLVATAKAVLPEDSGYIADESVADLGNHREPNLELLASLEPELVIIGQRFAGFYEEIKTLLPQSVVIDLNIDVSEEATTPGENLVQGFKNNTLILGKIFEKETEAEAIVTTFESAISNAKEAYNGSENVMGVIVSGDKIGFSAPRFGRVWGPLFDILDLDPALLVEDATTDHQGDNISSESIAQSNPDWLLVLDRDAAVSTTVDATPAKEVIEDSEALETATAIKNGQVVYAPVDTYTNESIQTYTEIFEILAAAFNK